MEGFITSFLIIFTAELGDKTQFLVFSLSLRYGAMPVLLGASLAFATLNGPGVFIGEKIAHFLNPLSIKLCSGLIFIAFGILLLLRKDNEKEDGNQLVSQKSGFILAFTSIFLGEIGDKTQICSVILGARFKQFGYVFSGCFLALFLATLLAVFLGSNVQKWLPNIPFKKIAGFVMIVTGIVTLLTI